MKRVFQTGLLALGVGLLAVAPASAAKVPAAVQVPEGQVQVLETVGVGVQIYDCVDGAWRFREPKAALFLKQGGEGRSHRVGIHYVGPTWESTEDGSKVVGAVQASAAAPRSERDIPWLLLRATSNSGTGVFGEVDYIQRLDTKGGVAPTGPCDAARRPSVSVPYKATYAFWAPEAE